MAAVELQGISKSFGATRVLRGVDLAVDDGEFVAIVGPSGCGKSTLLRALAGLEEVDEGSIRIGDRDVTHERASDRDLAMVFQSYALYPHLSVAENIAVPLRMRELSSLQRLPFVGRIFGGSSGKISAKVAETAKRLEIEHLLGRKPGQLSGGQRQRVALARAIVREPAAFLLDEPLSNLDAKLRVHTRAEIAQLHRRLEATFVYVTHDQVEAMTMADRIAVMKDGVVLQFDTPSAVYERPAHLDVATFVGTPRIATFEARNDRGMVLVNGSPTGVASSEPVTTVACRPEDIEISASGERRMVEAKVVHVENLGHETFVHVEAQGATAPVVVRRTPSQPGYAPGSSVHLKLDPARLHAFDSQGRRMNVAAAGRRKERVTELVHG